MRNLVTASDFDNIRQIFTFLSLFFRKTYTRDPADPAEYQQ